MNATDKMKANIEKYRQQVEEIRSDWTRSEEAKRQDLVNRSDTPCTYLVVGSWGAVQNVTHYPDRGDILYDFEDGSWRLQRTDGTLIKGMK